MRVFEMPALCAQPSDSICKYSCGSSFFCPLAGAGSQQVPSIYAFKRRWETKATVWMSRQTRMPYVLCRTGKTSPTLTTWEMGRFAMGATTVGDRLASLETSSRVMVADRTESSPVVPVPAVSFHRMTGPGER